MATFHLLVMIDGYLLSALLRRDKESEIGNKFSESLDVFTTAQPTSTCNIIAHNVDSLAIL